jgi:hypothetical protein
MFSVAQRAVGPPDPLTRFIFSSSHFAINAHRVKAPAISPYPNQKTGRLEWSVYRADSATSAEMWEICGKHVDNPMILRIAKARGTCAASVMIGQGLRFDPDGKPHPRHVNVVGWPRSERGPKHKLKNIQQKIAAAMTLEVRP